MTVPVPDTARPVKPTRPFVVATLRAAIEAAAIAFVGIVAAVLTSLDLGSWNLALPAVIALARVVEGFIDDKIDPTVQRGRLGGGPAPVTSKPAG